MVFASNGLNAWAIRSIPTNESALLNGTAAFWIAGSRRVRAPRPSAEATGRSLASLIGFLGTALMLVPKGEIRGAGVAAQFGP